MKKLIKLFTIGGLAAALVSSAALAADDDKAKDKAKGKKPDLAARFAKLDGNSDGFVDAEELKAGFKKKPEAAEKMMKRKDKNADGKLDKAEFTATRGKKKPEGDKPKGDKPKGDKPKGDKPKGDKPEKGKDKDKAE